MSLPLLLVGLVSVQAVVLGQGGETAAKIEGTVVSAASGEPLKRARVMLFVTQGAKGPRPVSTDSTGRFSFANVDPGTYRIVVERPGFLLTQHGSKGAMRPGTLIRVASGEVLKDITVRMQPHCVIAGRVVDEDGEPVEGVQVTAMVQRYVQGRQQWKPTVGSSTDDLGEYRLFGLPPGKYYLLATFRGGTSFGAVTRLDESLVQHEEAYTPTYYPGALNLSAGQSLTDIHFRLQRTRTVRVRGRVVPRPDRDHATLMLVNEEDGMDIERNLEGLQLPDGTFEIRGVAPGSYRLFAHRVDQGGQYIARMRLTVGNSNVDNIELLPRPGVSVSGRVRIEGNAHLNPAVFSVNLQPKEMDAFAVGAGAQVRADGTFTIQNVQPNTYNVLRSVGGDGVYVKSIFADAEELQDDELVVSESAGPTLQITLSTAAAKVRGQISADEATALPGALVVLVPRGDKLHRTDLFRTAAVDNTGIFSMAGVPPGEYTAYAWENVAPDEWPDPEFLERFAAKGKKVVLKENDNATLDLELLKVEPVQ